MTGKLRIGLLIRTPTVHSLNISASVEDGTYLLVAILIPAEAIVLLVDFFPCRLLRAFMRLLFLLGNNDAVKVSM